MPRIRTIKPDFWTDEALTECSLSARLMFIGMFNFADDNGNMERSSKQLKMKIFPADVIDCETLLGELMTHGLVTEYSVSDKKYLHIKGFAKHQVINRPSKTNTPQPQDSDDSLSAPESLNDGREGKGREGKGDMGETPDTPKQKRFSPPTVDLVTDYCIERKNSVDSEKFVDFYSAKGWMIGKNKIKDWKACVRTWEKSDSNSSNNGESMSDYFS